ncbi:MAG TPA: phosphotransferase [Actinopolymorphaceae bacterium]|jgi:spectinomycin phosphotransferase
MLTPPPDLTADDVIRFLRTHWTLDPVEVSYVPAGHGSHNWSVVSSDGARWFLKASHTSPDSDFFQATAETAAALHAAGLDFVLAPVRARSGNPRPQVSPRWELSLFPHIDGRNPDFTSNAERALVAETLGRLHAHRPLPDAAVRWEPGYLQPELQEVLARELDRPWCDGPYGERARSLLVRSRSGIERLLAHSDELVARLESSQEPWVITHGEPHGGNTLLDSSGRIHLIDCDAMMVAPRERDLRLVLYASHRRPRDLDNAEVMAAYQRQAGQVEPRLFVLELFRAEWHLMEICRYARLFSRVHSESADTAARWTTLNKYVSVEQNWPNLNDPS